VYWPNPSNFRVKESVSVYHYIISGERGKQTIDTYRLVPLDKKLLE